MLEGATDQLLADLDRRAATEVEAVLAGARVEAARLIDTARADAARQRAAALAACDLEGAEARRAAVVAARQAGRAALLEAQHALVDRVLAAAKLQAAARLNDTAYAPQLSARIEQLCAFIPGPVELRCPPSLLSVLEPSFASHSRVRPVASATNETGFILVGEGGRVHIDDTVDSWLNATRAEHAISICRDIDLHNEATA